jgi:hypothetical protein
MHGQTTQTPLQLWNVEAAMVKLQSQLGARFWDPLTVHLLCFSSCWPAKAPCSAHRTLLQTRRIAKLIVPSFLIEQQTNINNKRGERHATAQPSLEPEVATQHSASQHVTDVSFDLPEEVSVSIQMLRSSRYRLCWSTKKCKYPSVTACLLWNYEPFVAQPASKTTALAQLSSYTTTCKHRPAYNDLWLQLLCVQTATSPSPMIARHLYKTL